MTEIIAKFKKASLADFDKIYSLYEKSGKRDTTYTATSIVAWQELFSPKFLFGDGYAVLSISDGSRDYFVSPLAKSLETYKKAVETLLEFGVTEIRLATESEMSILEKMGFTAESQRNMAEYLYDAENLITLSGKKYHSKRNFINSFSHPYTFREYKDEDLDEIKTLLGKWRIQNLEKKEFYEKEDSWSYLPIKARITDFDLESSAIEKVLSDRISHRVFADVLEIDGEIRGFCAGEILPGGIGAIYFEKGDINYKGIYPLIDNLFCRKRFGDVKYINKQEDMGISGLRQSKLNYHPSELLMRYTARLTGKE